MRLAGIVLYNPDIERLKENIEVTSQQVDEIVCIDNGSSNIEEILILISETRLQKRKKNTAINLIRNQKNLGIAKALNQILLYARDQRAEWVLSLDQDSIIQPGLLDDYDNFINSKDLLKSLSGQLCMLTTIYEDRNSELRTQTNGEYYEEIKECITSASYANVEVLMSVGGYDEDMFIDYVDYDMCATLKENGYSIVRINKVGLIHEVGKAKTVRLFGIKTNVHNESAFRKYYQVRNHLYYIRKHDDFVNKIVEYRRIIKLFILTAVYEKDRRRKLSSMIRGITDSRKMIISKIETGDKSK